MKSAHLKGGKGQRPHQNKMEGKKTEGDQYFMYNMAILVGSPCEVTVRETIEGGPRKRYDGIFAAYTSERHEILIEAAHRVEEGADDEAPITEHYDMLVVPTDKMLTARFKSVDTHYATRDFTDQAIASSRGSLSREKELKELTPWDGPEVGSDEDLSLDGGLSNSKMKENGWEAKDMFKKNEEKYGVTSSFKNDLSGYTTQLDKSDIDAFKRAEHQASQIAQEIEKNTVSWERSELENGEDEEEVFSAVVRPSRNSAGHSNLNNNNNNNNNSSSTSGNDKYIPPSRRQGNIQSSTQSLPPPPPQQQPPPPQHPQQQPPQQPQNLPINNNGASQMNNNGGGGNPRKPMYGQNQNPRGNYGVPNNPYHDRRSNYDPRGRGPPPNQYNNPNSHNEARRMDGNDSRPQRMPSKPGMERRGGGRDDPNKLKEFSSTFRLQGPGEQSGGGGRRMSNNPPPQHPAGGNMNTMGPPPLNPNSGPHSGPSRNISPSSAATQAPRTNNKDEAAAIGIATPTSTPTSSDVTDKGQSSSGKSAPTQSGNISSAGSPGPPSASTAASIQAANESTPPGGGMSVDNQTPSSVDSKNSDLDSKKKFTFNPNAKEFNPSAKSFSSRSPSTPPRPPSTPAQPSTPQQQMMPAQPMHSFSVQIPMQMVYAAQPYPQTAALTPSSNSSASSGGNTPRHAGHRKVGAGMLGGVPPRSDMTPPIQMTAGPPLIAPPGTMQATAAPPQFAFVPQHYQQVMRVTAINQMYPGDGSGAAQMHQQVQYLHNGGAPNPNPGGHPNNSTPPNNPSAPTPLVPANGQGYGQAGGNHGGAPHVGYPLGVMPFMGYPHPQQVILPYVAHSHQGEYQAKPQAQQKYILMPTPIDGMFPQNAFPISDMNEMNYHHIQQAYAQAMRPTPSSTPVNNSQASGQMSSNFNNTLEQSEKNTTACSNQVPVPLPTPPLSNMQYPLPALSPAIQHNPQLAQLPGGNALQYFPYGFGQQSMTFVNRACSDFGVPPFPSNSKTPVLQMGNTGHTIDSPVKMSSPEFSRNRSNYENPICFSDNQAIERPSRNFSPSSRPPYNNPKHKRNFSHFPGRKNQPNRPFKLEKDRVRLYD